MIAKSKLAIIREGERVVPEEPITEMLIPIARIMYPEDWEAGKIAQSRIGIDVIPPNHEMESAYGQYQRVLKAAPQLDTPPVLRWEGNDLKLFSATVACVITSGRFIGLYVLGRLKTTYPTEQEARRAAEKALGFPDGLVVEVV